MRELSATSCGSCVGFARQLEDLYEEGGRLASDGWEVVQAVPTEGLSARRAIVDLRVDRSRQLIHPGDGSKAQRFPGGLATFSASMDWAKGVWRMNELELLE